MLLWFFFSFANDYAWKVSDGLCAQGDREHRYKWTKRKLVKKSGALINNSIPFSFRVDQFDTDSMNEKFD